MPELPEVQTTVDDLNRKIRGRKIVGTWYDWSKLKAISQTEGHKVEKVTRRGKNVLIYLDRDRILLVHMKMTGHLLVGYWKINGKKVTPVRPPELKEKVNNYIHFILTLDDGRMIGFSDLRKFGKVVFGEVKKVESLSELKKLGPDALKVSLKEFSERVSKRNKTIYQVLMDQTVVSGIGNIYANDIMWKAKVYPFKPANKLSDKELAALYKAGREILTRALQLRGTSTADYRDTAGAKGKYGDVRYVYQREGEKCSRCGTVIKRAKKGGRSTHYCPNCQK